MPRPAKSIFVGTMWQEQHETVGTAPAVRTQDCVCAKRVGTRLGTVTDVILCTTWTSLEPVRWTVANRTFATGTKAAVFRRPECANVFPTGQLQVAAAVVWGSPISAACVTKVTPQRVQTASGILATAWTATVTGNASTHQAGRYRREVVLALTTSTPRETAPRADQASR